MFALGYNEFGIDFHSIMFKINMVHVSICHAFMNLPWLIDISEAEKLMTQNNHFP